MTQQSVSSLGSFLFRFRTGAMLTQEELADRSGVSVRTISDLERGIRQSARSDTLKLLAGALEMGAADQGHFFQASQHRQTRVDRAVQEERRAAPRVHVGALTPQSLPSYLTTFVGRGQEIGEVRDLLRRPGVRLLTLTGTGGIGKTRLALEAARAIADDFDFGVRFCSLAAIDNDALVATELARALALPDGNSERLAHHLSTMLQGDSMLLVIDNFERAVEAAPLLTDLLIAAPSLTILTTSRIVLRISGEIEYQVPPLDLPRPEAAVEDIAASTAVRLFLDRAYARDEKPSSDHLQQVATLCQRLEGLPLSIELAAARTRVIPLPELLPRLQQRLPLLSDGPRDAPARHRSLRQAIGWSYDLLSPEEQSLFRALSVFEGGFTAEAAAAVGSEDSPGSTIAGLATLLEHSLVHRVSADHELARYALLETIREYGLEQLRATAGEHLARERHLTWFIGQLGNPGPDCWLRPRGSQGFQLMGDQDNLRSALSWALENDMPARAAQIGCGLLTYWWRHGSNLEGETTLTRILEQSEGLPAESIIGLTLRAGGCAYLRGNFETAHVFSTAALKQSRHHGYLAGIESSLHALGLVTRWSDGPYAVDCFTEALEVSRKIDSGILISNNLGQRGITRILTGELDLARADFLETIEVTSTTPHSFLMRSFALGSLAWITGREGNCDEAERLAKEALSMAESHNIRESRHYAMRVLGEVAMTRQDYSTALSYFQQTLFLAKQATLSHMNSFSLAALASVAQALGDWQRAAQLYGAAQSAWEDLGFSEMAAEMMGCWDGRQSPPEGALDDAAYRAAYETGQTLSSVELVAIGMAVTPPETSVRLAGAVLSPREIEVVRLMAEMYSNRQIADILFVSRRTIDSHVQAILSKLDVSSRRDAVVTARQLGLVALEPPSERR